VEIAKLFMRMNFDKSLLTIVLGTCTFFSVCAYATTVKRTFDKALACECMGKYARFEFIMEDGRLAEVRLIESSSSEECDEFYANQLKEQVSTRHPNGVSGIGIFGYRLKQQLVKNEKGQCEGSQVIEFNNYWHVEQIY